MTDRTPRAPARMLSMPRLTRRRLLNCLLAILACCALVLWVRWLDASLQRSSYQTGYLMLAAVLFLAAYNVRKKLPGLPLGSSRAWMQLHLYVGLVSAVLLGLHTGWRWPNGYFESALAGCYAATFVSGLWGLYLTRTIPRQLSRASEQIVYERIPQLRAGVLNRSRAEVLRVVSDTGATTLAEFYTGRVDNYLAAPRGSQYLVRPTSAVRRRVMAELTDLRRFLSEAEEAACEKLFALIRKKDDLDFHAARQGLLKGWLFLHIVLTYTLVVLGALHGVLALAMRGGPQ